MSEIKEFEVLDDAANAVVARDLERNFPGLLVQGDTLKILLDDIDELREEAAAGNLKGVEEVSNVLREKIVDFLVHYEKVLEENGCELPYVGSVRS